MLIFSIRFSFDCFKPQTRQQWSEPRRPRLKSQKFQKIVASGRLTEYRVTGTRGCSHETVILVVNRFLHRHEESIGCALAVSVRTENEIHANLSTDPRTQSSEPILFADITDLLCRHVLPA